MLRAMLCTNNGVLSQEVSEQQRVNSKSNDSRFRVEDISASAFCNGHAQIDVESHASDSHTRIVLVGAREICIVSVVVVMVAV